MPTSDGISRMIDACAVESARGYGPYAYVRSFRIRKSGFPKAESDMEAWVKCPKKAAKGQYMVVLRQVEVEESSSRIDDCCVSVSCVFYGFGNVFGSHEESRGLG